ncbi:hypothetical protein [uncultured Oxalicibacterium sp.]|uniref:hypothetical protein n=1 Tax=uncultured Oxalicibacterium sp. TaxID=1168540 RepID=UPI0025CED846|nr:hypothetical protein [uncultured Oxalicibacterium sp.]
MTIIHKQVALEEAEAGMVLSDNVLDAQGQVLLSKGVALTEHTIAALARHDIAWLRIEMGEMTAEEEAVQRAYYSERIERLFRNQDDSPATATLHRYIRKYRLGEEAP